MQQKVALDYKINKMITIDLKKIKYFANLASLIALTYLLLSISSSFTNNIVLFNSEDTATVTSIKNIR